MNKTLDLVKDHLAKEAPKPDSNEFGFELPAVLINTFQLAITPSYARLTAIEVSHGGIPHVRSSLAFDYKTLMELHDLLGRFLTAQLAKAQEVTDPNAKAPDAETPVDSSQGGVA